MTAAEVSELVTAAVAVMTAAAAYLHAKTTRAMVQRQRPATPEVPSTAPESTKGR